MQIQIGNKLVEVDRVENGVPIIKATAKEIKNSSGRIDVIVTVPCLELNTEK